MIRAYYAAYELAGHHEYDVVLLDDEVPEQAGLINSGFFNELVNPERSDGAAEDANRAG